MSLVQVWLAVCSHCGQECERGLGNSKTEALNSARGEGWATDDTGYVCCFRCQPSVRGPF